MKIANIIFFILCLSSFYSISQSWKTFSQAELGETSIAGCRYLKVNPNDNKVWLGSSFRLFELMEDGSVSEHFLPSIYEDVNSLRDFVFYNDEIWFIDFDEGLFSFNGTDIEYKAPIQVGTLISIDNDDSLLIGNSFEFGQGYYAYKNDAYPFYTSSASGFFTNNVYQIFEDSYNRKWMTHWTLYTSGMESDNGQGYSLYEDGIWTPESPISTNIPTWNVKKFIESPTNQIYAATDSGLCRYNEFSKDWTVYNKSNTNMPSNFIHDIKYDYDGRLWAVFRDTAIGYTYNFTDWTVFDQTNSPLTNDEIKSFDLDTSGNVWVLGDEELHVLTLGEFEGWLGADQLPQTKELNIYPNPAMDQIFIETLHDFENLTIYSASGSKVFEQRTGIIPTKNIDISGLEEGVYTVILTGNEKQVVSRFIKM